MTSAFSQTHEPKLVKNLASTAKHKETTLTKNTKTESSNE